MKKGVGRPKIKNPSNQTIKKRLYRKAKKIENRLENDKVILKIVNGMKNFLKSPFKQERK
tara:strand:+ start:788 stop:967 length:180 start_codon:yes stop_codon:yes gene_type:complete